MDILKNKIIFYLFIFSTLYFFYNGILVSLFSQSDIIEILKIILFIILFILSVFVILKIINVTVKENIMFCFTLAFLYNPAIQSIRQNGSGIIMLFTLSIIFLIITRVNSSPVFTFLFSNLILFIITFLIYPLDSISEIVASPFNQSIYNLINVLNFNISKIIYFIPLFLIIPFFLINKNENVLQISFIPVTAILITYLALESFYTILLITYICLLSLIEKEYKNNNFMIILLFISYVITSLSFGIDNPLLMEIKLLRPFIFIKLYSTFILYFIIIIIIRKNKLCCSIKY